MKKIIIVCICIILVAVSVVAVFAAQMLTFNAQKVDFKIEVNGNEKEFEMPVVAIEGRTYLPLREMAETLGIGIEWIGDEQKIVISTGSNNEIQSHINFYLHKSYEVDTSEIRTNDKPFTQFELVYNLNTWKQKGQFKNFAFPDFDFSTDDFQDKYLAISFGREVLEMEIIGENNNQKEVAITYAEEYRSNTMFLYIMDKISIRNDEGSKFYIMNGTEKVFVGNSELDFN